MRRFLVMVAVASLMVVVGPAGEAEACSCAMLDPTVMLEDSDAAFVGTLVERPTEANSGDGFTGIWVFEVDEWVKGDLGAQVGVHSALDGAACGFEMSEGERAGVFLYNDNGRPTSGLCSVTTPAALLSASRPLVLDGEGPPVFLIAADTGRARLATLDAAGRLLNATGDDRFSWSVSVCPGGDLVVEVLQNEVVVRDVASLNEVRKTEPPGSGQVEQAWCLSPEADRLLTRIWDEEEATSRIQILGTSTPLLIGDAQLLDVSPDHLALVRHPEASVEIIDLASGTTTSLESGGEISRLTFSPSGNRLLLTEASFPRAGGYAAEVIVYDVAGEEVTWRSDPIEDLEIFGWIDEDRIAAATYPVEAESPRGMVLDITLGSVVEAELAGWQFSTVGDHIVSSGDGHIYVIDPGASVVELAALPTPGHRLVSVLDGQASLTMPDETTTTTDTVAEEPEAAPAPEPAFPTAVAVAVLGGVIAILTAGWAAIRRRRA